MFAQESERHTPNFEVFILPGGEANNAVQQIVQDSSGYLWFASQGGIHRWDGHHFKSYHHDPSDPTSISEDYIESLLVDSKGNL